jgi:hypothetical protein
VVEGPAGLQPQARGVPRRQISKLMQSPLLWCDNRISFFQMSGVRSGLGLRIRVKRGGRGTWWQVRRRVASMAQNDIPMSGWSTFFYLFNVKHGI